ncbi:MAG: threonine ammonia-lyase [Firmicutes bacterium]|nr:threonine ammonia-lyase [Bacillota bacterium]
MDVNDFLDAQKRLNGIIFKTPMRFSNYFSQITGANVYLKFENLQKTGSFKIRGAYNKIARLVETDKPKAVIACSAGNHAQGVAFAATKAKIKSTIVMPTGASNVKVAATKGYRAEVILFGETFDDAGIHARELAQKTGAVFIPGFDDEDIIKGAGTIGIEILHELGNVDTIIVPAGGGGLLAGIAHYVKLINPKIRIIGVQAQGCDALYRSFKTGIYSINETATTFADGIAVKTPGKIPFEIIKKYVDDMVTVDDNEIADVIVDLLERCKQVVEPSGASCVAAITTGKINIKGQNVVCILSGGNIDLKLLSKLIVERRN